MISHINQQDITYTKDYPKVTAALPVDKTISMRLIRKGIPGFITFRLSE